MCIMRAYITVTGRYKSTAMPSLLAALRLKELTALHPSSHGCCVEKHWQRMFAHAITSQVNEAMVAVSKDIGRSNSSDDRMKMKSDEVKSGPEGE